MYNICLIDCKKSSKGYQHTVYESGVCVNKPYKRIVDTNFISEILDANMLEEYTKDPIKFVKEMSC